MGLWHSLTRRRSIPEVPAWLAAVTLLFLSAYAGWAAVRPEGPPIPEIREPANLVKDSRELIADGEAMMQAIRDDDQRKVEQLKAELQARSRREAEREDHRAAAVTAARTWYGVIAAVNFTAGAWLLAAARKPQPE